MDFVFQIARTHVNISTNFQPYILMKVSIQNMLTTKVELNYFVWTRHNNYSIAYMLFNINFITRPYYTSNKMMEKCILANSGNFLKVIRCKLFAFFSAYNPITHLAVFKVCLEKQTYLFSLEFFLLNCEVSKEKEVTNFAIPIWKYLSKCRISERFYKKKIFFKQKQINRSI